MRGLRRKMMSYVVDMNVEYIMTNGNQFILTDWIPLTDTKIEMYFHAKDVVLEKIWKIPYSVLKEKVLHFLLIMVVRLVRMVYYFYGIVSVTKVVV